MFSHTDWSLNLDRRRQPRPRGSQAGRQPLRHSARRGHLISAPASAELAKYAANVFVARADPDLGKLRDVGQNLPTGDPSEWKVGIFSKQFWSGQGPSLALPLEEDPSPIATTFESTRAPNTMKVSNAYQYPGASTPDARKFAPDSVTSQVDMSGYLIQAIRGM